MLKIKTRIISKAFLLQLIKFVIVGAIGTLINTSVLFLLTEFFKIIYLISEVFGFTLATISNYVFNKIWTFEENIQVKIIRKYIQYFIVCLLSLILNLIVLYLLVEFFDFWYILAEIVAIMVSFVINFIGSKFWIFHDKYRETEPCLLKKENI